MKQKRLVGGLSQQPLKDLRVSALAMRPFKKADVHGAIDGALLHSGHNQLERSHAKSFFCERVLSELTQVVVLVQDAHAIRIREIESARTRVKGLEFHVHAEVQHA